MGREKEKCAGEQQLLFAGALLYHIFHFKGVGIASPPTGKRVGRDGVDVLFLGGSGLCLAYCLVVDRLHSGVVVSLPMDAPEWLSCSTTWYADVAWMQHGSLAQMSNDQVATYTRTSYAMQV